MTYTRALVLPAFLLACQTRPSPTPEPPVARKETPRVSEIASATIALPSSSLVAVTGKGVTAFNPAGVLAWTFKLPANDSLIATPAAAPNSYLYLRGLKTVYAIGPEGRQVWAADIEPGVGAYPSLVVLTDSSVAAVVGDTAVTCLTTTGTPRWTYRLPDGAKITGAPSSAPNGFLLIRTKDRIYALNSEGQLQWSAVVPPPT